MDNPINAAQSTSDPGLQRALSGEWQLNFGSLFADARKLTDGIKSTFLLATILALIAEMLLAWILLETGLQWREINERGEEELRTSALAGLISVYVTGILFCGYLKMSLDRLRGRDISPTQVFQLFNARSLKLYGAMLLVQLLVFIGLMLLVLPGVYLAIAYFFTVPLIVDRDLPIWEAMETSRKAVSKHWFKTLFVGALFTIVLVIGALPMLIGLIWTLPWYYMGLVGTYREIFGLGPKEARDPSIMSSVPPTHGHS